ncbi:thioredoxin family protein [Mucilaginibacter sp. AK015]|uniref:TlpA family protein disulfide reductase n=1 Tax=Mucilaginibacter sp. AK015 TaxID=2723072 RepID=UPI00160FB6E6|nr:thioredoxin family protein [Mucilaginibacter sp. AK015]MBB5397461.1 thiol-disulfide isomerase/thioredoxin [Mucilaginibacter sp. AK015]
MKRLIFLLSIVVAGFSCTQAQTVPTTIPPYKILTTNDQTVTPADLTKNKPVMIIYFAPDCPHCQKLINDMKPYMKSFKDIQVVMITFSDIRMVKSFQKDYGLTAWPNFILGTEGYTYTVQRFYQLKHTPFVAIYNKGGKLVQTFEKQPEASDLLAAIKKI